MNSLKETALSFDEFLGLAKKHYRDGGADVLECWDQQSFDIYVEMFGPMTMKKALGIFRSYKAEDDEWDAISIACAAGTW